MTKRFLILFILLLTAGCAKPVSYTLSGRYMLLRPKVVAVLPVRRAEDVEEKRPGVEGLIEKIVIEKLKSLNYEPIPFEEVEKRLGSGTIKDIGEIPPHELARSLRSESVLYTEITEWNEKLLVTYASLEVALSFELYSATGERLWQAGYKTKESDIRLDKPTMELAVIKTFEPRLERLVDLIFATLPPGPERPETKRFFDWLP